MDSDLVPRKYQEEVFEQARQGNVIAALSTGSGKTLISLLLIKWTASHKQSSRKVIIFLVPKVSLVEQQGDFIAQQTSLKVIKWHGALEMGLADRETWGQRFDENDVFVMTAQVFLNIVTHSLWGIDRVSLMIFDECHHTRKNHPYNTIMREYFQLPESDRPKIFGMTASPIWNPKDAVKSLLTLEENLNARIIGVREHNAELANHSPKPIEVTKIYPVPIEGAVFPSPSIFQCMHLYDTTIWDLLNIPWSQIQMRYYATLANLGPYAASLFLFSEIESQLTHTLAQTCLPEDEMDEDVLLPLPRKSTGQVSLPNEAYEIYGIILDYAPWFPPPSDPLKTPVPVSLDWCTPKIRVLVETLLSYADAGFQGIIFVEQRQIAALLSLILSNLEELKGKIRCAYIVGTGLGQEGSTSTFASNDNQRDIIQQFRKGELNLLIATSVAEEGLDFPACDLVIRFDPLQHMVGYVQSRGRARNKTSTFIIMIREDDTANLARYHKLNEVEPLMQQVVQDRKSVYHQYNGHIYKFEPNQSKRPGARGVDDEDDPEDRIHPVDLLDRERYVVPSTGAILTYDNALTIMNRLCDIIPHDDYTPAPKPLFTLSLANSSGYNIGIGYYCTLHMPPGLPLRKEDRIFTSQVKKTKKEAKRAVAFQALKALREREVIDEHLYPIGTGHRGRGKGGRFGEDVKGMGIGMGGAGPAEQHMEKWIKRKLKRLGVLLTVGVIDAWFISDEGPLWVHEIEVTGADDRHVGRIGVVTSALLPEGVEMPYQDQLVRLTRAKRLVFPVPEDESDARRVMDSFTRLVIWLHITGSPIDQPLTAYIIPLNSCSQPDFEVMERLIQHPRGNPDWSTIPPGAIEAEYVLAMNENETGRAIRIVRIRDDLTPMSQPFPGSREAEFPTYRDYFAQKWTRKRGVPNIPCEGPMIEGIFIPRLNYGVYPPFREGDSYKTFNRPYTVPNGLILPQNGTKWYLLPPELSNLAPILPSFLSRLSDIYRARAARFSLSLPPISDALLVEALTLPSVNLGFNNQRLETLGDAVLELGVSVYLFERWKWRHEGQLTAMRQVVIRNWFLMRRALENGLEQFINEEIRNLGRGRWRFVVGGSSELQKKKFWKEEDAEDGEVAEDVVVHSVRQIPKVFPRRSLQDCMEAIMGAAFLTGGFPMALRAGTSLGMAFGGVEPWELRYGQSTRLQEDASSPLFMELQEALGYTFRKNELLVEAITHPSFASSSEGQSYQRLEFLGDAILNLVVVKYLYDKFPEANSEQLAMPRSKAVCSAALASIAVRKLGLHKIILANSVELNTEISRYIPLLERASGGEIVRQGWRYDPPKAISDVFESVIGAIMVDSGYNYELTSAIVEMVMEDVLEALSPQMKKDPVSELTEWTARNGCTKLKLERREVERGNVKGVGFAALIHDTIVAGPILSTSLAVARFAAAERALTILQAGESPKSLKDLCTCGRSMEIEPNPLALAHADDANEGGPEIASDHDAEEIHLMLTAVELEDDE
ncbi:hypothetical protein AX16_002924 [Volvariella volvacea WC 439]|nr:hypothetical protein AX16_002924 [Volvariella volvacea WC 439]